MNKKKLMIFSIICLFALILISAGATQKFVQTVIITDTNSTIMVNETEVIMVGNETEVIKLETEEPEMDWYGLTINIIIFCVSIIALSYILYKVYKEMKGGMKDE